MLSCMKCLGVLLRAQVEQDEKIICVMLGPQYFAFDSSYVLCAWMQLGWYIGEIWGHSSGIFCD